MWTEIRRHSSLVFCRSQVIPARRHGTISVTFTSLKCDVLESGVDCDGYAHGYMSLDSCNVS